MNSILITVGLVILTAYLVYCYFRDGFVPSSVSATYYSGGGILFSAVMFTESIITMITLIELSPDMWTFIGFFAGAGLGIVGASPCFNDEAQKASHYTGAFLFGVASNIWAAFFVSPGLLLAWLIAIPMMAAFQRTATFIAEITCVVIMSAGVYILS